MKNIADILIDAISEKHDPTVAGLDPRLEYLPDEMRAKAVTPADKAKALYEFNCKIIDAICDVVPAVKLQSAFYELYGGAGVDCMERSALYAKQRGLITMADVKRNDIGSTAEAYAEAFLGGDAYDYITVNPYPGLDGIKPFTDICKKNNKGIFVLARMSNPSAAQIQNMRLESGETVYEHIGGLIAEWGTELIGENGYSAVGAVVGATNPQEAARLRKKLKTVFFLVPGYGAQGGSGMGAAASFDERGKGAIVNNSRGIIAAYRTEKYKGMTFDKAARAAALDMQADLDGALRSVYGI